MAKKRSELPGITGLVDTLPVEVLAGLGNVPDVVICDMATGHGIELSRWHVVQLRQYLKIQPYSIGRPKTKGR